ncbi:MAG: CopD family protein [Microbacterium sp.]
MSIVEEHRAVLRTQAATRIRRTLLGALAVVLGTMFTLLGAQAALAHAQLLSTTPGDGAVLEQAPDEARLHFDEAIRIVDGGIRLVADDEQPVALGARVLDSDVVVALPALEDGRYTLSYRVTSADGHPVAGVISFTVGTGAAGAGAHIAEGAGATSIVVSALTAMQYIGLLAFAGLVFFDRIVLRNGGAVLRRERAVLVGFGVVAAVASALLIPVSALNVTGVEVWSLIRPADWWQGMLWSTFLAAVLVLVGTSIAFCGMTGSRSSDRMTGRVLTVLAALVALSAPVLVGHSQSAEPHALAIGADIGHLAAGGFWVGGVAGLALLLSRGPDSRHGAAAASDSSFDPASDPVLAAEVVRRFSTYAVVSVLLLGLSGIVMAVMIVGTVDALVSTSYGWTLMLKLAVVASVIVIAGYNHRRLVPAVVARPNGQPRWRTLRRALAGEAVLLVVILAITGFLTGQSPNGDGGRTAEGRSAQSIPFQTTGQQLEVDGSIAPAQVGDNRLTFTLRYRDEPVTPDSVIVKAALPDLGPFQTVAELDPVTGSYAAALELPLAGDWKVQIIARVSDFDEPIVTVPVTVR